MNMTDAEIIDLFDSTDITMHELSSMTGLSIAELKRILMS